MRYFPWLLLIFLVFLRYVTTKPSYKIGDLVRLRGSILTEPVIYDDKQRLEINGLGFYLPSFADIRYGDNLVIEGEVYEKGIKNVEVISHQRSTNFFFRFRHKIISFFKESLPEPDASLIAGVTLGSKTTMPESFWEKLKTTGTAHVVVASGMNITLVAGFLIGFLVLLMPRKRAIPIALLGVWVYAAMSGFDAPIIRAAIMGSLGLGAQALGRLNLAWRALFISALTMLIVYPSWLFDLGFMLSFVATASLMLFEASINKMIFFVPSLLREGLSTSLAAQVGVAPIIYFTFGQFNLLSPLINALILWTIAPLSIFGLLAGLTGVVVPFLGKLILFMIYPLTQWFIFVIELFS